MLKWPSGMVWSKLGRVCVKLIKFSVAKSCDVYLGVNTGTLSRSLQRLGWAGNTTLLLLHVTPGPNSRRANSTNRPDLPCASQGTTSHAQHQSFGDRQNFA